MGANDLQRHGELLKGSLSAIRPGASEVKLHDYETEEEVSIALDPTLSPKRKPGSDFQALSEVVAPPHQGRRAGRRKPVLWQEKLGELRARLESAGSGRRRGEPGP